MAVVMFLFLTLSSLLAVSMCQDIMTYKFSKEHMICQVKDRVDRGCSTKILKSRSRVHCMSLCGSDKSCIGASLDKKGQCFHHKECPTISECTKQSNDHIHMAKYCAHGSWDEQSHSCKCLDGSLGDRCNKFLQSCRDLISLDYTRGFYTIYIDPDHKGHKPFLVHCYINPSRQHASVQMLRNKGQRNFNKTWMDYVTGFYYDDDHRWNGLYTWHRLSKVGLTEMYFVLNFLSRNEDFPNVHRVYYELFVSDESADFRFTFASSSKNSFDNVPSGSYFGDCLKSLQDVPFSTWDSDNDDSANQNCAAITGSGWWYTGCETNCNALGYGLQYLNSKPRNQIMSLLGVSLDAIDTEEFEFIIYLPCP